MDKKKKMNTSKILILFLSLTLSLTLSAQTDGVSKIQFCGNDYEYIEGNDSIKLFLKVLGSDGQKADVQLGDLRQYLKIFEDGKEIVPGRGEFLASKGVPKDYTFSVLVDLGIPQEGKAKIAQVIQELVNNAPDSCVYLSFFGDEVTSSKLVTRQNYHEFGPDFDRMASEKFFYPALYAKLIEIGYSKSGSRKDVKMEALAENFDYNADIARRAEANPDKNILFVFTDGSREASMGNEITYMEVADYQRDQSHIGPKIFAFYYNSGDVLDEHVEDALKAVTQGIRLPQDRVGKYVPSSDLDNILGEFKEAVSEQMYDFIYVYKATEGRSYDGKAVTYSAAWGDNSIGDNSAFSIGSPENPWPLRNESTYDTIIKYLMALIVTLLTIAFFFCIMKILIPLIKSKSFSVKYYKKYVQEQNIQKRICHYCKQPIIPGELVVTKCKHVMHVHCWQQNDYRCAEYGQNCNIGVQEHVDWAHLLSKNSIRDCQQAIAGILAGLISWIVYELLGRGGFTSLSGGIVKMFLTNKEQLFDDSVTKVSAFMVIGLLLGFFLSLIFRYNDEYRKKSAAIYMKIIGLSFLSSFIGLLSFAFGGIIFCMILSSISTLSIPWYCSLPAYLLFSVCTSLSLTIKSSIPVQSAMLGGLCSAIIGFLVLYFTSVMTSTRFPWMNMLLDFVIYGGGLGASLVTVRMLAEKYFLVIQNGIKAGTRIPIHKWMNATGGGNKVTIGMTGSCEIQMNWEKSNKVAKEHAVMFIDHARSVPVIKPLALGVIYNSRAELPVSKAAILTNGDTFKIGDTIFRYEETD